jgi:hypothetical protein
LENEKEATMKRTLALPSLAVALLIGLAAATAVSLTTGVPKASAYYLANGCDEYDPERGITYVCTPDRTTFYTPDGINPNWVWAGADYSSYASSGSFGDSGDFTINDPIGIPPPAPFDPGKDYCSEPWFGWSPFEGGWQHACYNHDVCYGSQLGRKYCDVNFWKDMISACKNFGWYNPARYACYADARVWYQAVVWFGADHYRPRATSFEP